MDPNQINLTVFKFVASLGVFLIAFAGIFVTLKSKTYAAGVLFQIDVTVAQGGATNYVDLFGYLVDA